MMQVLKRDIEERIIETALNEFLKSGYEKTTIRKIIHKTGISIGNFYTYFKNKKELFHRIIQPVRIKIENLKEGFFHFEEKRNFRDKDFINEFTAMASKSFFELIKEHRKELVLILDKSDGTSYSKFKPEIINTLKGDFLEDVRGQNPGKENINDKKSVFYILAKIFVEGIIEIAKIDNGDKGLQDILNDFFKYHFTGFSVFFDISNTN